MCWIKIFRFSHAQASTAVLLGTQLALFFLSAFLVSGLNTAAGMTRLLQPAESYSSRPLDDEHLLRLPLEEASDSLTLSLETELDIEEQQLLEVQSDAPGRPHMSRDGGWRSLIVKPSFDSVWLAGGGKNGLGITELKTRATVIVPIPIFGSPLMVSPSFQISFQDHPAGMEIPDKLYRASASIMWMKKPSERLSVMLNVTPGVCSDFQATDNAMRIFGFGTAMYQWKPSTQLILGVVYLDRADINMLPMAGLIWTPDKETRMDLTFPRPRFAKRIHWSDSQPSGTEDWAYFAGEMGGGTYAVERAAGFQDKMTLRDFRLMLGVERKTEHGLSGYAEIGYVLGREIEFERDNKKIRPSDTLLLRVGLTY